jgi:hypothetical protein
MNIKKLKKYSEKFDIYIKKTNTLGDPGLKLSAYNKILKIIKKLQFLETKGKVKIKPSLINLESFFLKGKKYITEELKQAK